jgi:hypothetical protein
VAAPGALAGARAAHDRVGGPHLVALIAAALVAGGTLAVGLSRVASTAPRFPACGARGFAVLGTHGLFLRLFEDTGLTRGNGGAQR